MNENQINIIRPHLYLNVKNRIDNPTNDFSEEIIQLLKNEFWSMYQEEVKNRGREVIAGEKELKVFSHIFQWIICDTKFKGDVQKGLYLVSKQGFGKDIILRTVVEFFNKFHYNIREYTNTAFCKEWFDKNETYFKAPIKINDIKEDGRFKRERISIPFLEFLDFREQNNTRRGIIVSSNFLPEALQEELENDKQQKRIYERIKEVFNIIHIKNASSKRIETKIVI